MTVYFLRAIGLIAILVLQPGYSYHAKLPEGMSPAKATWLWGHHSIPGDITLSGTPYWYVYPHTDVNQITNPVWSEVAAGHIKSGTKAPAVLMLHGCSGLSYGTTEYRRFFIEAGYSIFEPDSFARFGPGPGVKNCDHKSYHARVEEVEQALIEIRELDWVDQEQLFLMGSSQGGAVVAGWGKDGFAGHIILASACLDQKSLVPAAPKNVPVLSVVGEKDPRSNGASCQTNSHATGSQSVVIKGAGHVILDHPETGKAIAAFLRTVKGE